MKAVCLNEFGGYDKLAIKELPKPGFSEGEVLIKVHATAITPTEFQWFPTFKTHDGGARAFPIVLGHEFSGVVAAVGGKVTEVSVLDAVYGMNDWFANGAQAEYCVAPAAAIALKPARLDHALASVVPISALTAWQGLFIKARLRGGQQILIHGGSGAVGHFAVQLAHWTGARVIATASERNASFVRELGADEAIPYDAQRFEECVQDVDVVFDTVGGDTLERSWKVLRPGGVLVTVAVQSENATDERARNAFFIVEPERAQLQKIASLLDSGTIHAYSEATFPLTQAQAAYARAEQGSLRGKIVLQVVA